MHRLNLPAYEIKTKLINERMHIFDILRRKYISLTPEEWVRQHFIHYLVEYKGYPTALLANETELTIGEKRLRCDSVLYDRLLNPRMIIEYKAPQIAITQKVFDQIASYNMLLHAKYLTVSNGMNHYCCRLDYTKNTYEFLSKIPDYKEL